MPLSIEVSSELEHLIRSAAAKNCQDVNTFVLLAVNEKLACARVVDEIGASMQIQAASRER